MELQGTGACGRQQQEGRISQSPARGGQTGLGVGPVLLLPGCVTMGGWPDLSELQSLHKESTDHLSRACSSLLRALE